MDSSNRTLANAFKDISVMADRINLTSTIVDRANKIFKQIHDKQTLKGKCRIIDIIKRNEKLRLLYLCVPTLFFCFYDIFIFK